MADINQLIDDARTFASETFDKSAGMVQDAVGAIDGLRTPITLFGPRFSDTAPEKLDATLPEFSPVDFVVPEVPQPVEGLLQPDLTFEPAPENTAEKPEFVEPARPAELRQLTVTPPSITTSFEFPEPPASLSAPIDVPVLAANYEMPTKPQFSMPVFSALKPDDDVSAPTDYVERFSAAYREQAPSMYAALDGQMDAMLSRINPRFAEQMAALETRLAKYIEGGTALSAAVEDAIYERSRDKVAAETRRAREAAYSDAARRGFTLPPGVLNAAVSDVRIAGLDANARAATEIAIKQAELEQQNTQFAITTSANLRSSILSAAISYHSNLITINGQALDYSKSVLSAAVQVYDTLVKAFTAKLDAYRAEAAVYETQMRGALAQVQVYQAEIQALQAMAEVDQAKVAVYKARIDALEASTRVYRSQIDVVLARAEMEKLKIELFGEQVRAYGVEAQAKASEWQGYTAAISGQEARQRAYGEEVRAYSAEIEGYRAKVQAKTAQMQQQISYNEGLLRQYTAQVDGYRAVVDAKGKVASTQLDTNRLKLFAYQAKLSAGEAQARTTLGYYQTRASMVAEDTKVVLQAAIENARLTTQQIEAVANTSIAGARVYEGIATSALSGMNTLVTQTA